MSSWSMNIIIDIIAEIRKFMEMPASKSVVVCIRFPTWDNFIIMKTVKSAVRKEINVTPKIRKSSPKTMAKDAPKLAPDDTPRM